jgi:hypothetical protein
MLLELMWKYHSLANVIMFKSRNQYFISPSLKMTTWSFETVHLKRWIDFWPRLQHIAQRLSGALVDVGK